MKLKWPVCFSLIGGAPLGARGCLLESCSDDRALQEELCFRRACRKDDAFDTYPSSSL